MILKNWWEKELKNKDTCSKLLNHIKAEYLVIGGGIAGLHAALYLADQKKDVVLLEKSFCGGSSSGRSSGFLTPASELDLARMVKRYGKKNAKTVWEIPVKGVKEIAENIKKYSIECDFEKQDCLYLGLGNSGKEEILEERRASKKLGVKYKYYNKNTLSKILKSKAYNSGIRTFDTYSINSLLYCQGLKNILLEKGVKIFENSPVIGISRNSAKTERGSVSARKILVCADKLKKEINENFSSKIYHAQTFLTISEPLSKKEIKSIFPDKKLMCWDSRLIYSYFKITKDGRILLGGSSAIVTYSPKEINSPLIVNLLIKEFKHNFPQLKEIRFVAYWPGLIDISKDIMPIVDTDSRNPRVHYVLGNPGLPWAAFFGTYAAKKSINPGEKELKKYYKFVRAKRKFFVSDSMQRFIGKIPSFIIDNLYTEYYQVDRKL